ncbi:MAG TPA: DJ-1/PfpI family protein [Candidatus Kapabacteria bacterium]|nr:DJ-1/PfpI family protein [Candidatus Kapabacteria bacterium]
MNAYLYILDTMSDWEIAYITAELNSRRYLNNAQNFSKLQRISCSLEPVCTMGGMRIIPDEIVSNVKFESGDILIMPGANAQTDDRNLMLLDRIPDLLENNVTVAAICGATIPLARMGLLDNNYHTSNNLDYLKMVCPTYKGEKFYLNKPAVTDGNLITATGVAPLEFTYEVLKKMDVMKAETLEAWYGLFKTQEAKYFYSLMESVK